jgi:hypothetical protein
VVVRRVSLLLSSALHTRRCTELGLKAETVSALMKVWKARSVSVATSLLSKALSNNQLVDMDWVFGVTAASDDCDHVHVKEQFIYLRPFSRAYFTQLSLFGLFYLAYYLKEKC